MIFKGSKTVGIVGMPPLEIIRELNNNGAIIHDLDTPMIRADMELTAPYLPRVYCAILRTVVTVDVLTTAIPVIAAGRSQVRAVRGDTGAGPGGRVAGIARRTLVVRRALHTRAQPVADPARVQRA